MTPYLWAQDGSDGTNSGIYCRFTVALDVERGSAGSALSRGLNLGFRLIHDFLHDGSKSDHSAILSASQFDLVQSKIRTVNLLRDDLGGLSESARTGAPG